MEPGASSSHLRDLIPHTPPGLRQRLTPEQREGLLQYWSPDILDWVLNNEDLWLGDLIGWGIEINQVLKQNEIDWSELEHSSSDKAEAPRSGPSYYYGIPLTPCLICGKMDVSTRIVTSGICYKKAHTSCLQWTAKEDPRKPGHFRFQCPNHNRIWFLEG